MNSKGEGILGTDWEAKGCPECGLKPRIHTFKFLVDAEDENGRSYRSRIRYSYYDCPSGHFATDWWQDPFEWWNRQRKYLCYAAREAWDLRRMVGDDS